MKIIITGGAGFIGSHLSRALVKRRHQIKIIDNLSSGSLENLKDIKKQITLIKGDIRHFKLLKREFKNYDFVLHQAALTAMPASIKNPKRCHEINVTGTLNILQAARQCRIKKVVFASSCAVYGDRPEQRSTSPQKLPPAKNLNKESASCLPQSPYALSKLFGEYYCQLYAKIYQLPTFVLRYFNVYGPGQRTDSSYAAVIPNFIDRLLKKQKPIIYGNGTQTRDFIYIADIVQANLLALRAPRKVSGQTFNIATGQATSINELFSIINEILKIKRQPAYQPARLGDIRQSSADLTKAKQLLKFKPKYNLRSGLREYLTPQF